MPSFDIEVTNELAKLRVSFGHITEMRKAKLADEEAQRVAMKAH